MDYCKLLKLDTITLIKWLDKTFYVEMITEILDVEDMNKASKLLICLSSYYSYLCSLLSYAKVITRKAKRELTKEEYEDMIDRREAIANKTDAIKQQYSAISRAVTIHIENNAELKMNTTGCLKY